MNKNSGCFMIRNKDNNKVYICTSKNMPRLYAQIKYMVRNNKFSNKRFQEDMQMYGEDRFSFHVIQNCDEDDFYRIKKESIEYFEADDPDKGYNDSSSTYNL